MARQTFEQWAAQQPVRAGWWGREGSRYIADTATLINRADAWNLADVRVLKVEGGTIWFIPRSHRRGASK